jgi:hypothetical protein
MRRFVFLSAAVALLAGALAQLAPTFGQADGDAAPIYGVKIPAGFLEWSLINVAHEAAGLNDFRAVLGNPIAIKAFQDGTLPFPDGTFIARLAWKYVPSDEDNAVFGRVQSFVTGAPTNLEFMVKDSKKYARVGRLGIRSIHKWQARRRGGAQNVLLMPPARERAGFGVYALRAFTLK